MGIALPCPQHQQPSASSRDHHFPAESSSLYSQPSLPSVPSLQLPSAAAPSQNAAAAISTAVAAHSSYVSSLLLAGKHLFSSSSDGTVRVWSRSGHLRGRLVVSSNAAVKSIIVCGDRLFTAHQDHKIRVWRIEHHPVDDEDDDAGEDSTSCYRCVATLPTLGDRVSRMFLARNYVTVRRHKRRTWVHHNDAVSALAVSADGTALYSASWDRTFKVWRASDFRCLESIPDAHDDAINAIAVASADGRVYTGSADRRIKVWARESPGGRHGLVETLEKHRSAVNALAASPDGRVLYSGACDRSVLVWERGGGGGGGMEVMGALRGHSGAILSLGVAGDLVCSGSADCSIRVWKRTGLDNKSYACLAVLEGHRRPVKCLSLALDHNSDHQSNNNNNNNNNGCSYLVYSGGLDCEIRVWKLWVPS